MRWWDGSCTRELRSLTVEAPGCVARVWHGSTYCLGGSSGSPLLRLLAVGVRNALHRVLIKGVTKYIGVLVGAVSAMPTGVFTPASSEVYAKVHLEVDLAMRIEIMPNFVEFDRQDSHSIPDEPMFTLQRRGLISLNLAAFKALGEPAAVALLYDADEGVVALRKVSRTYHNGYSVRKQGNSRSYLVAATGFTSYHKINTDVSRRYMGRNYGDQTWGFAVAEGTVLKTRTRTSKASVHDIRDPNYASRPANGHGS